MSSTAKSPKFIVDNQGKRVGVVLDIDQYEALVDAREELEDIRAFDEAKAVNDETVPFETAVREIENKRS